MRNARSQKAVERTIATNIWTARVIPFVLIGAVGYTTYVTVVLLCSKLTPYILFNGLILTSQVNYVFVKHGNKRVAIPLIVIYLALLLLVAASFLRLFSLIIFEPPYVPLGPAAIREKRDRTEKMNTQSEANSIGAGEYNTGTTRDNLDSPGLELFYTKDVFVCEPDGKPIWCSHCANWKPDRTHHDSSSGRCIARMDHFCPWVGGPVGENNFKFFIQFTFWTALCCLHILIITAFFIHRQLTSEGESLNNHFAAALALGSFFFIFTSSITGTSVNLALRNLTSVERLGANSKVHLLAVRKPPSPDPTKMDPYLASNPPYREITYPLGAGQLNLDLPALQDGPSSAAKPTSMSQQGLNQLDPEPSQAQVYQAAPGSEHDSRPVPSNGAPKLSYNSSSIAGPVPPTNLAEETQETVPATLSQQAGSRLEKFSSRDLKATRTFAVLKMEPGENPWDLGSPLLNFKAVMGNKVIDWFLPTRSPCGNHEDPESHYQLGPIVARLRKSYFPEMNDERLNTG